MTVPWSSLDEPPGSSKGVSPDDAKRGRLPTSLFLPRTPMANREWKYAQTDVCKSSCANETSAVWEVVWRRCLKRGCEWAALWANQCL